MDRNRSERREVHTALLFALALAIVCFGGSFYAAELIAKPQFEFATGARFSK